MFISERFRTPLVETRMADTACRRPLVLRTMQPRM
jgi:hypothetical protein